jgi:hypothetical protein
MYLQLSCTTKCESNSYLCHYTFINMFCTICRNGKMCKYGIRGGGGGVRGVCAESTNKLIGLECMGVGGGLRGAPMLKIFN